MFGENTQNANNKADSGFRPNCPNCGHSMVKSGFNKWFKNGTMIIKQRYSCSNCGRTTIKLGD